MQRAPTVRRLTGALAVTCAVALQAAWGTAAAPQQKPREDAGGFRFKTGVDLVNVTATVTDSSGRFVPGLRKEDFLVYEDEELQSVAYFSNERVPVSLGIALDTSGSMAGDKIVAARRALDRFLYDLLDRSDEIFLFRFSGRPMLLVDWTTDRDRLSRALGGIAPGGDTALYDTVAEAAPLAQTGRHRKKALVVISDGNDTSSGTDVTEVKQLIRETEVLVYAIGIDGRGRVTMTTPRSVPRRPRPPIPIPFPIPGRRTPPSWPVPPPGPTGTWSRASDRVNVAALRELTDDSGGRTEIIRDASDLEPATASVADELSRQYYLGYATNRPKDGRWHAIRVEVRSSAYRIRARRGYIATP